VYIMNFHITATRIFGWADCKCVRLFLVADAAWLLPKRDSSDVKLLNVVKFSNCKLSFLADCQATTPPPTTPHVHCFWDMEDVHSVSLLTLNQIFCATLMERHAKRRT
jgi:hypothetical protein